MTPMPKSTPVITKSAAEELADLELRIASIPFEMEAAVAAGDRELVAALDADERVLRHQLPGARRAALVEQLARSGRMPGGSARSRPPPRLLSTLWSAGSRSRR